MRWFKFIFLGLLILALAQYLYFGIEDCGKCRFNGMKINEFFKLYMDECLKSVTKLNVSKINLTQVEPLKVMENLSFKDGIETG